MAIVLANIIEKESLTHTAAQHQGVIRMFWLCLRSTFLSSVIMDLNSYPAQSMYVANYGKVAFIHLLHSSFLFFSVSRVTLDANQNQKGINSVLLGIPAFIAIVITAFSVLIAYRMLS